MLLQCIANVKLTSTGPRWGRYFVGPIQFAVCYGAVVACTLLGGQCMKVILTDSFFFILLISRACYAD